MSEKKKALQNLRTARGQLEGIIQMIEDERYCVDISNQILASAALLKKANVYMLTGHLNTCVMSAIKNHEQLDEKMEEIELLLKRF